MKKNKLLWVGLALTIFCLAFASASFAENGQEADLNFPDLAGHWAADNITKLAGEGVIEGYPDGTFQPNATITRAEFCTMLARSLDSSDSELLSKAVKAYTDSIIIQRAIYHFNDVSSIPDWAKDSVGSLVESKVIIPDEDYVAQKDYPARLEAEKPITRIEVAGMAGRALSDFDGFRELEEGLKSYELHTNFEDDEIIRESSWSIGVACALGKGLIEGYPEGNFLPGNEITRAEAATVLARLLGFSDPVEKQNPKVWSWKTSSYDDMSWEAFLDIWN